MPGHRRRINIVAICVNVFAPWILFSFLCAVMSFSFHYTHASWAWGIVACGALMAVIVIAMAIQAGRKRDRDPMWYTFSAITLTVSVLAGTIIGHLNFFHNMQPYYDIRNLNTYPSVNPSIASGQEMMDAGRVYFAGGTALDMKKSMSFQDSDLYCVAPIVQGEEQLAGYDFWAVGVNCCSGVSSDFRCGQFNNPAARSGLRLMRADQRAYFQLAVQQAEAAYKIRAPHPLFFEWMQDPTLEMETYMQNGWKYFMLSIFTYFACNLFCVTIAIVGFSKTGHYP